MTLSRAWSLGTPFVTLAIAGIYLPGLSYSRRLALVAVGGALAAGTCLVAWPLVLLLIALLVATGRGPGQRAGAVLVPLGAALVALLPGIVAGPERFWDQAVGFHAASSFDRRGLPQVMEWWRQSPAGLSLLAVACCGLGLLRRGGRRLEPLALIGAGCAVVLPVLPAFAYGEWVAPLLPLVVLVAIDALWLGGAVRRLPFRHAAWLFVAVAWIYPFPEVAVTSPSTALPALARALDEEAGPGPILTPLSALAVEARRPVVAGTELGMFALGPADEEQRVRRLRLTTLPALSRALGQRRPAAVVLLDVASRWNFRWVMPSLTAQPEEDVQAFARALEAQYRPGRQEEGFVMLLPRDGDVGGASSRRAR